MVGETKGRLTVALDIGTTHSGYAFSRTSGNGGGTIHNFMWEKNGSETGFPKTPTVILFDPNKTFHSFGHSALETYEKLAQNGQEKGWFLFRNFKLALFKEKNLSLRTVIKDFGGKPMFAVEVFRAVIEYMRDHFFVYHYDHEDMVEEDHISWVLTVPSIWDDAAKQLMRIAAEKSGIPGRQLKLACEAECASLLCHRQESPCSTLTSVGTSYIIMNCGGGIVDMVVHEVGHGGKLQEICSPMGGLFGSCSITEEFFSFLSEIFGCDVRTTLSVVQLLHLERQFEDIVQEISKESFSKLFSVTVPEILLKPTGLFYKNGYNIRLQDRELHMDVQTIFGFFQRSLDNIVCCLRKIFSRKQGQSIRYVLMVGGLSQSPLLQNSLRQLFPLVEFLTPKDVHVPTMKGAVLYGQNPKLIKLRIAPRSYGIRKQTRFIRGSHDEKRLKIIDGVAKCVDIFDVYVQKDELLEDNLVTEFKTYSPVRHDQTVMRLRVYSSDKRYPVYTTEPGCRKIGHIIVQLPNVSLGKNRRVRVRMVFEGNELKVRAIDDETGKKYLAKFDFLHNA